MYSLDILKKNNIIPTWQDIYYGIEKNFLELKGVSEFAIMCMERKIDEREDVLDLIWKNESKEYMLQQIRKLLGKNEKIQTTEAKWQYCIVKDLLESNLNFKILSEKLDEVYADFGYPLEMEEFISYMPIKDGYNPASHSFNENAERITRKVKEFLELKQRDIKKAV